MHELAQLWLEGPLAEVDDRSIDELTAAVSTVLTGGSPPAVDAERHAFPGKDDEVVGRQLRYVTETIDGTLVAPLVGGLTSLHVGSLRIIGLPNFWDTSTPTTR